MAWIVAGQALFAVCLIAVSGFLASRTRSSAQVAALIWFWLGLVILAGDAVMLAAWGVWTLFTH